MSRRVAIIVLNYNKPDLTIQCLSSIDGEIQIGKDIVVVVDNGSDDNSVERIEHAIAINSWQAWVRVVRCYPNQGFAGGNNIGIRAEDAQFYLLLNNDTILCPGVLAALLAALHSRPSIGLIGPSMKDGDGLPTASCFRDVHPVSELLRGAQTGLLARALRSYETQLPQPPVPAEVDWIGFACVLIRREVFEAIGLLDSEFYLYFDDNDFCRRARAADWRILYWPDATIVHYMGATTKLTQAATSPQRRPRYYYASRARYFAKFYGVSGLWAANLLWMLGRAILLLRQILDGRRRQTCRHEGRDIWINCGNPLGSAAPKERVRGHNQGQRDSDRVKADVTGGECSDAKNERAQVMTATDRDLDEKAVG